eukprot:SAG22_NODE_316_length_12517_cov_75.265180_8_plen_111_part_00
MVPLERSAAGPVPIVSVKYWIAIPWLYNRDGWGMFINAPGDGRVDVSSSSAVSLSFVCQKQLDLWVTAAPAGAINPARAVYSSYAHATVWAPVTAPSECGAVLAEPRRIP